MKQQYPDIGQTSSIRQWSLPEGKPIRCVPWWSYLERGEKPTVLGRGLQTKSSWENLVGNWRDQGEYILQSRILERRGLHRDTENLESCRDFLSNLQLSAEEYICARKLPEPWERKWDNPWSSHMLVVVYVSTSRRGKILVIHVTSDRVLRKALILRT